MFRTWLPSKGVLPLLAWLVLLLTPAMVLGQRVPFAEREIDREYRALLQQLAEGTSPGVVAVRLRRLEDVCFEQGWEKSLGKQQREVIERVEGACGPDCLLPILHLHQELVLEYVDTLGLVGEEPPRRAMYALGFLEQYFEALHSEQDKTPAGARARADLATSFGVGYRNRGMVDNARARFLIALEHNPEMVEALHLLASLEEKLGLYDAARPPLERLLVLAPHDAVARLRLAMVDARTGREPQAVAALEALLAPRDTPGVDDWVRRLAVHRLARLRAGDSTVGGDPAGARWLLERGLVEFPQDQPMVIALAFYTEDRDVSRELLEQLAARPRPVGLESARGRYNNWPGAEVAALPRRLHALLERTNALLGEALVAIRGPEMLP